MLTQEEKGKWYALLHAMARLTISSLLVACSSPVPYHGEHGPEYGHEIVGTVIGVDEENGLQNHD